MSNQSRPVKPAGPMLLEPIVPKRRPSRRLWGRKNEPLKDSSDEEIVQTKPAPAPAEPEPAVPSPDLEMDSGMTKRSYLGNLYWWTNESQVVQNGGRIRVSSQTKERMGAAKFSVFSHEDTHVRTLKVKYL